jgi:PAS domain S-box-containing protein
MVGNARGRAPIPMPTFQRDIQERLGSALHTLTTIEQQASSGADGRRMQSLLKQCRQLVIDLEHGFSLLQEATSQHAALRQQVEAASMRASLLFEVSPVPCLVVHEDGEIAEANAAATRLLNLSQRSLQGKPVDLFLGGDRDVFRAWLRQIAGGTSTDRRAAVVRPREQRAKDVTVVAAPEAGGRIALVMVERTEADVETVHQDGAT